jgi:hypothetical protein
VCIAFNLLGYPWGYAYPRLRIAGLNYKFKPVHHLEQDNVANLLSLITITYNTNCATTVRTSAKIKLGLQNFIKDPTQHLTPFHFLLFEKKIDFEKKFY